MTETLSGTTIFVSNGEPSEKILVIAQSFSRFKLWCKQHKINCQSSMVKFVWRTDQLRGYSDVWFVDLGIGPRSVDNRYFYSSLLAKADTHRFKEIPNG